MLTDTQFKGAHVAFYSLLFAAFGLGIRLFCASRGYNWDVDSYRVVADIVARGGNVYQETGRYNYGPIWFYILHWLDQIPWGGVSNTDSLRWKVAIFLSLVDIGIFYYLAKQYSLKVGALFLFNPISIIITGYHSQFDNLAVLVGMLSIHSYSNKSPGSLGLLPLVGLGISLSIKHILFMFPLWLAFKAPRAKKVLTFLVPTLIFICGFLPFLLDGAQGIVQNVLLYKSFDNAPLAAVFLPNVFFKLFSRKIIFLAALFIIGLYYKKKSPMESFWIYLISLILFSSAIANQYLAICIPAIAILFNRGFAMYSIFGGIFLAVQADGLHLELLQNALKWEGKLGYEVLMIFLSYGFLLSTLGEGKLDRLFKPFKRLFDWLRRELQNQLR